MFPAGLGRSKKMIMYSLTFSPLEYKIEVARFTSNTGPSHWEYSTSWCRCQALTIVSVHGPTRETTFGTITTLAVDCQDLTFVGGAERQIEGVHFRRTSKTPFYNPPACQRSNAARSVLAHVKKWIYWIVRRVYCRGKARNTFQILKGYPSPK